jgi:cell division initiation protein
MKPERSFPTLKRKMNADLLKTEGDMNLYIEKLLSNFKSALSLIESAKAAQAPQPIQTAPKTQEVPAAQEAPAAEAPAEDIPVQTEETAEGAETAEAEPFAEAEEEAAADTEEEKEEKGANVFDVAAETVKKEEKKD